MVCAAASLPPPPSSSPPTPTHLTIHPSAPELAGHIQGLQDVTSTLTAAFVLAENADAEATRNAGADQRPARRSSYENLHQQNCKGGFCDSDKSCLRQLAAQASRGEEDQRQSPSFCCHAPHAPPNYARSSMEEFYHMVKPLRSDASITSRHW